MNLLLKTIKMRLIELEDAEFVLSLRLDPRYNTFISDVRDDIEAQKKWIKDYKVQEAEGKQYYFIIETKDGVPCGTVRIYDLRKDSFSWGSWILNENKTRYAAVESALLVYQFGFEKLKYLKCHFEVMKGNQKVIDFHTKFGAEIINEDDESLYFEIYPDNIKKMKAKFGGV